jgi:hypothetical protein
VIQLKLWSSFGTSHHVVKVYSNITEETSTTRCENPKNNHNENQKTYNYSQSAVGSDNSLPENNLRITRRVSTHNMA